MNCTDYQTIRDLRALVRSENPLTAEKAKVLLWRELRRLGGSLYLVRLSSPYYSVSPAYRQGLGWTVERGDCSVYRSRASARQALAAARCELERQGVGDALELTIEKF